MTRFYLTLSCFFLSLILFISSSNAQENSATTTSTKKTASSKKNAVKNAIKNTVKPAKKAPLSVYTGGVNFSGESLTIADIKVEGQKKIEKDSILNRLRLKKGQAYSGGDFKAIVRDDIATLFKTGFFSNIDVFTENAESQKTIVFKVQEKPSVVEITWDGVSEDIKKDELNEALGIKSYEILNVTKLKEGQDKVQKFYEDKGYFLAKIDYSIEDVVKNETVKIKVHVKQNDRVKVKKITFLGNKKVPSSQLIIDQLVAEEGYFSGLSGSGQFKQDMFERWIQGIRFIYFNKGFIQAKIDRPQVTVTPDKKGIYITINIEEGEAYDVGEIDFSGDILFSRQELLDTMKLDENKIFAYDVLQRDLADLQAKYGDLGYAFANVNPQWKIKESERKVDIVFDFDKGNKVYFGRIQVISNTKTRDKVVRRELKIREGELYNETRRRLSLENIQRLGFFDEVNFKTSTPPDKLDILNIDITVKERNTGQIQLGAGYGSTQGFTLQGSVQQTNFMGRGQNLGISLNLSREYNVYDFTFTEPYFRDSLWSLGFRVFRSENTARTEYEEKRTGGSIFLGYPLSDYLRINSSYTYTASELKPVTTRDINGNEKILTDLTLFPLRTAQGDSGLLGVSLDFDTRNDRFRPTKGIYARLGYSLTGPFGGNLNYYKANGDFRFFKNIFWDVVFRNSFSYARIESTDSSKTPPFNELYLLGGPYSLRGYRYGRVGRQIYSEKAYDQIKTNNPGLSEQEARERSMVYYGGAQQLMYQGELLFPLIREAQMYGVAFYDVGQAEDTILDERFFADTGFGIRWFSPIGPLRFEWGFPLNREVNHEAVVFEFSIGTPF
ncbi:MAG: outer membrane protein assembly factor BamA [Bdellovibrionaceae bacterium]|nr:outer membrane protein assembly factor BamA [Pseudobdellovibrionaceae bacterium]